MNEKNGPLAASSGKEQAEKILRRHLRDRNHTGTLSDEELLALHPHLRVELQAGLKKAIALSAAFAKVAESPAPSAREGTHDSIACPACHAPIDDTMTQQVAEDTIETVCRSCGRHVVILQERNDDRVAHFELIDRLGSGGFGTVWRAFDTNLDREIALKVARRYPTSPADEDAFVREAKAAAMLKHPNIVATYEVGRDGDTAFIAGELIEGTSLKERLDRAPFDAAEAASLCRTIAGAVHYAHEEGVIHRDLKPQNILLDFDGAPHIADFGLARRDSNELTITMDGQVVGTPAYMSPEQALGNSHTSDRRSDVYALGVILFELLTGELPFRGSLPAVLQQVVSADPPMPRSLQPRLPRDLETICLKCLEKRPERRFATAHDLAADLQRFLNKQPIVARPVGTAGRVALWCQRNRAIATLLGLLVLAVAGISGQAIRATRAQQLAEQSAQRTGRVLDVLIKSFRSPDPEIDGHDVKMIDVLKKSAADLESELPDDPILRASLLNAIGESMQSLGVYAQGVRVHQTALKIRTRELGEQHPDTMASMANLAALHYLAGEYDDALRLFKRSTELRQKVLGEEHPDTLKSMNDLAIGYTQFEDWDAALRLCEKTHRIMKRTLGEGHLDTLKSMSNLGRTHFLNNQHDQAEQILEEALALSRLHLGEKHPTTIIMMSLLAGSYHTTRPHVDALRLHVETMKLRRLVLGADHPDTLFTMNKVADSYLDVGRVHEAIGLLKDATVKQRAALGDEHLWSIDCMVNLGRAYLLADQPDLALPVLEEANPLAKVSQDRNLFKVSSRVLAEALLRTGQNDQGRALLDAHLIESRERHANDPESLTAVLLNVTDKYFRAGLFADAERYSREALELLQAHASPNHWLSYAAQSRLGGALAALEQLEEAESLLIAGGQGLLSISDEPPCPPPQELVKALQRTVAYYERTQQPEAAATWRAQLEALLSDIDLALRGWELSSPSPVYSSH